MDLHLRTKIPRRPRLMFLGKKYGSDETVFSVECGAYDARVYCDLIEKILNREIDYVVIETSQIEQLCCFDKDM